MQKNNCLFSSASVEWATPQALFDKLDAEFHLDLDPCSTHENAKCAEHFTKAEDGLSQNWGGKRVFCNPPYGRELPKWIKKAHDEAEKGALVVMLIPARTDTRAFHDYIYHQAEIRFLRGRIRFVGSKWNAPFPSMVVIFEGKTDRGR